MKSADLFRELERAGWILDRVRGSHHVFTHPAKPGHISVPHPRKDHPDLAGWIWSIVDVDLSRLDDEAEHVDVVLPRRVLRAIDSYAERQGETRNGFLARAALDRIRREAASPS